MGKSIIRSITPVTDIKGRVKGIGPVNKLAERGVFVAFTGRLYNEVKKFFIQYGIEGIDMYLIKSSG